jgi:uncharacterized protein with HEPN domain
MFDYELVVEVLDQLDQACNKILSRIENVVNANYFTDTPQGMEKFDSICMVLIAIGESLKNLDKLTDNKLLAQYPQVDWKNAKGMRDIISHHYFQVDAEVIYNVCKDHIPLMSTVLKQIINDVYLEK